MKPQQKFELRKQELFTQISELINQEGYENLTIRYICKRLAISTGTFYHYFPDKDDLVFALFSDIDDYFEHEVTQLFTEDEIKNLITYCVHYGIYIIQHGVETCRCISVAPLKANNNYLNENRQIYVILSGLLNRGQEKGQLKLTLSVADTTRMILVLMRGYSADWAKQNGCYDLPNALSDFITLFSTSLRAKEI